jgi:hypothetical protein
MNPSAAARRLIEFAHEVEPIDIQVRSFPLTEAEERVLAQEFGARHRYSVPAEKMLADLKEALLEADWNADTPVGQDAQPDRWTFGTAMTLRAPSRQIHAGFLDPIRRIPILTRVPEKVVLYLITVGRGEDYLQNEAHSGVGWHYHYLDWRKNRSDVVLCWDTRWKDPVPQTVPLSRRGLFVEKHAEKGKPFRAKPWLWGDRKRETMYEICSADLAKRRIDEYRCAANKAELVYPPGAMLTPHPSNAAPAAASTARPAERTGARR